MTHKSTHDLNDICWQRSSQTSFVLFLAGAISLDKQKLCWSLAQYLRTQHALQTVVGMNTLTVYLDRHALCQNPSRFANYEQHLTKLSQEFIASSQDFDGIHGKHIDIQVIYGGEYGADLQNSAKTLSMSAEQLVACHTEPLYTVYCIGFQAGFAYLGGLPQKLHLPRLAKPRTKVPAGSVGIGGAQTGIYPFESPGGWQLLGRTDAPLFDKNQNPPTLLQAGDTLRFVATDIIL